jgi:hypothetical protein
VSDPSRNHPAPASSSDDDRHGTVLSELVTEQLRSARAGVFHAWLQARDKANRLAQDDQQELPDRRGAA